MQKQYGVSTACKNRAIRSSRGERGVKEKYHSYKGEVGKVTDKLYSEETV